jgi:hypothetical protein
MRCSGRRTTCSKTRLRTLDCIRFVVRVASQRLHRLIVTASQREDDDGDRHDAQQCPLLLNDREQLDDACRDGMVAEDVVNHDLRGIERDEREIVPTVSIDRATAIVAR